MALQYSSDCFPVMGFLIRLIYQCLQLEIDIPLPPFYFWSSSICVDVFTSVLILCLVILKCHSICFLLPLYCHFLTYLSLGVRNFCIFFLRGAILNHMLLCICHSFLITHV